MADLAKDIEQLKQLKSDLEQFSKRQPEIETIKKKISKREAEITEKIQSDPKYGPRDENGNFAPVTEETDKIYSKIRKSAYDRSVKLHAIAIILTAIPCIVGLVIIWKKIFDWYWQVNSQNPDFINDVYLGNIASGIGATIGTLIVGAIFCAILFSVFLFIFDSWPDENAYQDRLKLRYAKQIQEAKEFDGKATGVYKMLRKEIPSRIADASNNDSQLVADRNKLKTLETEQATVALRIIRNDVLSDQDKDIALVDYVYSQLSTRRADSVKEALQRYDDKKERDLQVFRAALRHERELEEQRRLDEERREEQRRREARLDREREALRKQYESDNEKLRDKLDDLERSLKR